MHRVYYKLEGFRGYQEGKRADLAAGSPYLK